MNHSAAFSLCLTTALLWQAAPGPAQAEEAGKSPASGAPRATALVRQLGSESYQAREQAARELTEIGKSAATALRDGLRDDDAEVRRRCQELLTHLNRSELEVALDAFLADKDTKLINKVPAWSRYRKLIGDDEAARALFVEMCCSEAPLLDALEKDHKGASNRVMNRCQEIFQQLYTPQGVRGTVTLGQVVALMYAATDSTYQVQPQAIYQLNSLLYQQEPRQGFTSNSAARKLLVAYVQQRSEDQNMAHQNMNLAMQFDLKECVEPALKMALAKEQQVYTRATAIIVVGRLGTKDHIDKLKPILSDPTAVGQSAFNQVRINTQLRDVALAMSILLSGQQPLDYEFPYLQAMQQFVRGNMSGFYYSPHYLGFSDDAGRDKAFKKWEGWLAAQTKSDGSKKK
jgi:hypothetical protein